MAISMETLKELISDAQRSRESVEKSLADVQARFQELAAERDELRREEETYRATLARRFPTADAPLSQELDLEIESNEESGEDWVNMARTDAVEKVVLLLSDEQGVVRPADIEGELRRRGRTDSRDAIGGALAYLNKNGRVKSVGYGTWTAPLRGPMDL